MPSYIQAYELYRIKCNSSTLDLFENSSIFSPYPVGEYLLSGILRTHQENTTHSSFLTSQKLQH